MRHLTVVLIMCVCLSGCGTPKAYMIDETQTGIKLTTEPAKLFGIFPIEGVPAGRYEGAIGDKSIKVDTKLDLKLMDFNFNKVGE